VASQSEVGNLLILDRHWTRTLVAEMETFPSGSKDDQVDALSRAFSDVVRTSSAEAMIAHLRGEITRSQEERSSPSRPVPGDASPSQSLVRVYRETAASLRRAEVVCMRCRQVVGASRVEDGVSVWHTECF